MNSIASKSSSRQSKGSNFLSAMALTALAALLGLSIAQARAAVESAASGASAPTATQKTERVVSDSWITTKVKSSILANSLTKGFHVDVKTFHGVVTLSGKLATQEAIDQVKTEAGKIKGVKSVDTSILVVATQ
jgi:hyperosmotically inducible protein